MSDETIVEEVKTEPVQVVEQEISEEQKTIAELRHKLSNADRKITDLAKDIEKRNKAGKSIEERMADLEREREIANRRADSVTAFSDAGLGENWRTVFDESDPFKRAEKVHDLLKAHEQEVAKKLAADFGKDGSTPTVSGGKPTYSMKDLESMSESDINRAFAEGRVQGMQ